MTSMLDKISGISPEITLLIAAAICLLVGLMPKASTRRLVPWVAAIALIIAFVLATRDEVNSSFTNFIKASIASVGFLLLLLASSVPEQLTFTKHLETGESLPGTPAAPFDPSSVIRGEFVAFMLFSLAGAMLTAGANDLVWLFLSLELTSLPTYVMIAISRDKRKAQEAAVKYFFLGAMAAALFLYGFALIYGATGTTVLYTPADADPATFVSIQDYFLKVSTASPEIYTAGATNEIHQPILLLVGFSLAIVGICFKIAAFPMHVYAADVYEGAPTPVTAFLSYVPKTAGFIALIVLLGTLGFPLPGPMVNILCLIAVFTMTLGNTLGLAQTNVKRTLAYSSIAHSGYLLVALAGANASKTALGMGVDAILFYLIAYGLANVAAFGVLSLLETRGEESQTYDDISGLAKKSPGLAVVLLVALLSLVGLPPLAGFVGKLYLFGSAFTEAMNNPILFWTIIIAVINSAVSAGYYLRIAATAFFGKPEPQTVELNFPARRFATLLGAVGTVFLGLVGSPLIARAHQATDFITVNHHFTPHHHRVRPSLPADPMPVVNEGPVSTLPSETIKLTPSPSTPAATQPSSNEK